MTEPGNSRNIARSVGAVFAGIAVGVALALGTDLLMHAAGVFPPWGKPMAGSLFVLAFAYRTVYSVAASYVTARLAPYGPMGHALAGGVLGLLVSIVGTVTTWNRGPEFGPHWYPLALVFTALPTAWAGAKVYLQSKERAESSLAVSGSRGTARE
jgi:hypothetical protein